MVVAIYTAIVQPDAEQTVAQDLGADQGTFGMIAAGLHGDLRRARSPRSSSSAASSTGRCGAATRSLVAALIDGLLFGVIHYDFSGADALLILPPLGVLGFIFCLVYERTARSTP